MKRDDTRNHILDTATEMFWSTSYHAVNMNALSRKAGLNKATIYQYFASKEDLAVAAVNRAADLSEDYVYKQAISETDDPQDQLRRIYQRAYEIQKSIHQSDGKCRGCPFVNIGVELSTTSPPIRKAVASVFIKFEGYYQQIATANGPAPTGITIQEIAAGLMANMNGCLVAAKLENRPEAVLDGQKRALRFLTM